MNKQSPGGIKPKKPRMQDIAKRAGVSVGTVSRALSGNAEVAPELVESVRQAAKELGYVYESEKQSSVGNGMGTIGYLVDAGDFDDFAKEPSYQYVVYSMGKAMNDLRGHVTYASCHDDIAQNVIPSMVRQRIVSGVIVDNVDHSSAWLKRLNEVIPTVLLGEPILDRSIPSVTCGHEACIYQILTYLRELGHQRIGFLSVKDFRNGHFDQHDQPDQHDLRLAAFRQFWGISGCVQNENYIQVLARDWDKGETLPDTVAKAMRQWIGLGADRPTAIVCATDVYAFSLLALAPQFGINVPDDLSVIGVMNTRSCELSVPSLTSVSLSENEIVQEAVRLLLDRIQNPKGVVRHSIVNGVLVERLSCKRLQ